MDGHRPVTLITVKRLRIVPFGEDKDKHGHWWVEVGDPLDERSASYGWWPMRHVGAIETLVGVAGSLNGVESFGGRDFHNPPPRDPHHGESAHETFHPRVVDSDPRDDDEIADCLRGFAISYSGEWRWTLGWGQNCHAFQKAALAHCGLLEPP